MLRVFNQIAGRHMRFSDQGFLKDYDLFQRTPPHGCFGFTCSSAPGATSNNYPDTQH